jgi:hypothetical protein
MDDPEQPPSKRVKLTEPAITVEDEPFDDVSDFWDSEPEGNNDTAPKQEIGQYCLA